jgi:TolA-binding protein
VHRRRDVQHHRAEPEARHAREHARRDPEAAAEFERTFALSPDTKLGSQGLYRAAMTQTLYLDQHGVAIENLKKYIQLNPDAELAVTAQKEIGEILFTRTRRYREAIRYYEEFLGNLRGAGANEAAEVYFRIGKSHLRLHEYAQAVNRFTETAKLFPDTKFGENALYEIGAAWFIEGKETSYPRAIHAFEEYLKKYPTGQYSLDAKFGIASALEETDRLEEALQLYQDLEPIHPSRKMIRVKLQRIKDRMNQRSRSRS